MVVLNIIKLFQVLPEVQLLLSNGHISDRINQLLLIGKKNIVL